MAVATRDVTSLKATVRRQQDTYINQQAALRPKGVNHQSDLFRGLDANREAGLLITRR